MTTIHPTLTQEVHDASKAIMAISSDQEDSYEVLEARLNSLRLGIQRLQSAGEIPTDTRGSAQSWFKRQTTEWLGTSPLMQRATQWPQGYPGDYLTLESIYSQETTGDGLGSLLDRYFLSRTLAVAVRSRRKTLSRILQEHAVIENGGGVWLNIACGASRELDNFPAELAPSMIHCIDSDPRALEFASARLQHSGLHMTTHSESALRYISAARNRGRFGRVTMIYSAGLFDYIDDEGLARLLHGLYRTLDPGGVLVAPFKDATRYETFDYHWLVNWNQFFQRTERDFQDIFRAAGVPTSEIAATRDPTGVLIFYSIRRAEA